MKRIVLCFVLQILLATISFGQAREENLQIIWPSEFKWKIVSNQEDSLLVSTLLVPEKESLQRWSILGWMSAMKNNFKASNIDEALEIYKQASLRESPKAKYNLLEKDGRAKNFWAIFKVENPDFPNDPIPESQLWYIFQGNSTLYVNFVAIKEKELNKEFVDRWTKVFKTSRLVYK